MEYSVENVDQNTEKKLQERPEYIELDITDELAQVKEEIAETSELSDTQSDNEPATKTSKKTNIISIEVRRPYQCDICHYKTARPSHLKLHIKKHTGEKPLQCDMCDYKTARAPHLRLHKKRHTGEKPFECDICDYRSAQAINLKDHMKRHTGERPYECAVCGYRAARNTHLSRHIRIHTGVKPYKCKMCDYTSAQPGNLNRHVIRRHSGKTQTQSPNSGEGNVNAVKTELTNSQRSIENQPLNSQESTENQSMTCGEKDVVYTECSSTQKATQNESQKFCEADIAIKIEPCSSPSHDQ